MVLDTAPFQLPKLRKTLQSAIQNTLGEGEAFWDAKFYPYDTAIDAAPIFALTNKLSVLILRIVDDSSGEVELLHTLVVDSGEYTSDPCIACEWGYLEPEKPLLLVAGDQGLIRVFDAVKGELTATLRGHGNGNINDLATHPKYPWIVASASQDTSVRVWDLRRCGSRHESSSIIICGHGHGHQQGLLSVGWHHSGRYLISGGHDHRICIWTLPDLAEDASFWEEISLAQRKRSSDEIRIIHYPHFTTSAIHSNFVDCVRFYGDRVFSKAAFEDKLVFWEITGFDGNLPPPDTMTAPKTQEHLDTRNGFMRTHTVLPNGVNKFGVKEHVQNSAPFTRLLEFAAPKCESFYIRFEILKPRHRYPDLHPVLAIGNQDSQVSFWDLHALNVGHDGTFRKPRKPKSAKVKKGRAQHIAERGRSLLTSRQHSTVPTASSPSSARSSSVQRSASTEPTPPLDLFGQPPDPPADRERFKLHAPHKPIKPLSVVQIKAKGASHDHKITTRTIAWSACGKWCVAAGETWEPTGGWTANARGKSRQQESKMVGTASIMGRWYQLPEAS